MNDIDGDLGTWTLRALGRHGNTEMTGLLSVGGTHADTDKELYVNGDIEATATLEVGANDKLSSTLDVTGNTEDDRDCFPWAALMPTPTRSCT